MTDLDIQKVLERLRTEKLYWRNPHTGDIHTVVGYSSAHKEFADDIPEPVIRLENNKTAALWECRLSDFVTVQPAFA